MAPRRSKKPPRRPKRLSRGLPRGTPEAKTSDSPKAVRGFWGSRLFGLKTATRGLGGLRGRPQTFPRGSQAVLERLKTAQESPKTSQGGSHR
eukprot:2812296-Pyramimonas_sp.AAC.1